ncbi:methyltransferase domain-containing protein [Actinomadura rubrisoli]|nr:methyltransferase domain-containing protein [Actinomadura rubrisoli]
MSDTDERADDLRRALVAELTKAGSLRDPRWTAAFEHVPRHAFVPRFLGRQPDGTFTPVDGTAPARRREWLEQVYTDEPLITEVDGTFSVSSSSQPSLMAEMLEALEITGPERVLEIGTGTGYNAGLLCAGLGSDEQVVSVDIAAELVETARGRLSALGYQPTLVTVDGAAGYPGGAPYDRIIATCSLPEVPRAWLAQVRDGGLILVNLYRELGGGALARLRVEEGCASGRFMPFFGGFMPTRTYPRVPASELLEALRVRTEHGEDEGTTRPASVGADALTDETFGMLAALCVNAEQLWLLPDDAPEQFWLLDHSGSWANQTTDADGALTVTQGGPARLWDQLEAVHREWITLSRPPREEYGLTVAPNGDHVLWHMSPDGPSWPL